VLSPDFSANGPFRQTVNRWLAPVLLLCRLIDRLRENAAPSSDAPRLTSTRNTMETQPAHCTGKASGTQFLSPFVGATLPNGLSIRLASADFLDLPDIVSVHLS
jgi:hypothetical protein